MTCPRCGHSVNDPDAPFCISCGAELRAPATPSRRRVWLVLSVAAVLVVVAIVVALVVTSRDPEPVAAPPTQLSGNGLPEIPTELPGLVTPPSRPPRSAPAALVQLSVGAGQHPTSTAVQTVLTAYYTAINTHDYDGWLATVTPAVSRDQPRDAWLTGYRSTRDDQVEVRSIVGSTGGVVRVAIAMRSTQDPADAPPDLRVPRICWTLTLPVDSASRRIGPVERGSTTKRAC